MLLNLKYWREHHVGESCLSYIESNRNRIVMLDQDALNVILQGKVMYLHPKYNCMTLYCAKKEYVESRVMYADIEEVSQAVKSPVIIHYLSTKPWVKGKYVPFRDEWIHYLSLTPWADMKFNYAHGWRGYVRCQIQRILKTFCPWAYRKLCADIY
jgi:lipopolysaccharide biosynthesis glycosyltransferase